MRLTAGILALAALLVLTACESTSRQERAAVLGAVRRLQTAVNRQSVPAFNAAVSPDFTFGGLPSQMSMEGLRASLSSAPGRIEDVQLLALRKTPEGFAGRVALYMRNSAMELPMTFAPDGRIRAIGGDPGMVRASARIPDAMTSRFLEVNGLIFVKAEVDGRKGWFLVDSGASDMLLNAKYFKGQRMLFQISAGVHGLKQPTGGIRVGSFRWEGMTGSGITASITDLSHLETPANTPLLGAIGHAQMRDSAMVLDWKARRIQFFATRRDGSRKVPDPEPARGEISFRYDYHMPVFPAVIGGKEWKFLFDSGASVNLVPGSAVRGGHFRKLGAGAQLSDGGQLRQAPGAYGTIDSLRAGNVQFLEIPVIVHSIPYLEGKGLLGALILREGRVEINFRAQVIRFWR